MYYTVQQLGCRLLGCFGVSTCARRLLLGVGQHNNTHRALRHHVHRVCRHKTALQIR